MADENKADADNVTKQSAIEKQGATTDNLSEGQSTGGAPNQPEIATKPEQKQEQKQEAETKKDEKVVDETTDKKDEKKDEQEYPVYNDAAADSVTALLKEAGVSLEDADKFFKKATETQNLDDIDLDGLTKAVGKEKATLIMIGVKDYYNRNLASTKETLSAIYNVVGGESNWTLVREWAAKKAESDKDFAKDLDQYNSMFNLNKKSAVAAMTELKSVYEADKNNKSLSTTVVHGDSTDAQIGTTLTKAEYLEKIKVAEENRDYAEANRLRAVRSASRKAGVR